MRSSKRYLTNIPLLVLLAANIIPLFGVLYFDWDAFLIVLLYWTENLAVGFYNILKMAFAKMSHPLAHLGKLFLIPFFMVHYGGFMAIHGIFILAIFKKVSDIPMDKGSWPCFFIFLQLLLNVIKQMYSVIPSNMKFALLALFVSHGISFVYNYLLKGEFVTSKPDKLMGQPYARVVEMHIAILAGGFLAMSLGSPLGLLLVLIVLKTVLDVKLHLREHRAVQKRQ